MSYRVGLVWCVMRYAGWVRDGEEAGAGHECKEIFWCHQPGIALGKFSPRTWPIINPFHFVNPSSSAHGLFVIGFFGLCEAHHLRVQISYLIPISIELGQNTPASKTPSGHQATTICRVDNLNQAERWRRALTSTNHKAYFRLLPFPSNSYLSLSSASNLSHVLLRRQTNKVGINVLLARQSYGLFEVPGGAMDTDVELQLKVGGLFTYFSSLFIYIQRHHVRIDHVA